MNSRRYLSGADWILNGLAHAAKQTAQTGNYFQIVLELGGTLDETAFCRAVETYCAGNPLLGGTIRRAWNLVPFWQPRSRSFSVPVECQNVPAESSDAELLDGLASHLIAPLSAPGISFRLLRAGISKTVVAIRFDHRLFDAQGAERFVLGLQAFLAGRAVRTLSQQSAAPVPSGLCPWKEKFVSGQAVNRLRIEQLDCAPFQRPIRGDACPRFRFSRITLTREETDALMARAYKNAGYLMLTPYLASLTLQAVHQVFAGSDHPLKGYVVPCSVDTGRGDELFFNHLSFICLSASGEGIAAPDLARTLARQFYRQISSGLPAHFENAWKLLRIVPAALLGTLLCGPLRSFMGSFSLAHVGDGLSALTDWMGLPVQNAFHMPIVPPAPGLGFFTNTVAGRLNLCMTSYSGALNDEEHREIEETLRQALKQ